MTTSSRIEMRCDATEKELLRRAAALSGKSTTTFIRELALQNAQRIIDQAESLKVSVQSYQQIMELLDDPPEPNESLLKAHREYKASGL